MQGMLSRALIVEKYEKMLSQQEYGELAGCFRKQRADVWIPKFRCIIYFDLRVPGYSNMVVLEKGKP